MTSSPLTRRRPRIVRLLVAVILLVLAAGCSGPVEEGFSQAPFPVGDGEVREDSVAGMPLAPRQAPDAANRQVIRHATMSIQVPDPARAAQEAAEAVDRAGGRIDHRTERPPTGQSAGSASLTMRVPADSLDRVIEQLRALGTVSELTISSSDVTIEVVDLDARIDALATSVARLQEIMATASSAEDLIAAETALAERQAQLDGLRSQREHLADQVELSTLDLYLAQRPETDPASGFAGGLREGWETLLEAIRSAIIGIGLALPWVIFLSIGAGIIYGAVRLLSRRSG
ncbi:DUF4349 domain-containing protein [Lolliginicoccus levis]|uniref:DUF4349 domain-containing protein n=1 Tax=Lolliginicoccus levis TaxID=2919542 RepID=UPI00241C3DE5|nr:DUF4349 domain-containing protein [Lolliginicoccus levis]